MESVAAHALPLYVVSGLEDWELVTTDRVTAVTSVCTVGDEGIASISGQPVSFIQGTETHANYKLEVQWRWPAKPGNGGILLHIATGPKDRQWPECYQVQLKHGSAGDLLPMAGATFAEPLSTPPGATTPVLNHTAPDSENPAGVWNTATIICKGDTITVSINGAVQNRITGCSLTSGRIGFQLEGTPFELRQPLITPLP